MFLDKITKRYATMMETAIAPKIPSIFSTLNPIAALLSVELLCGALVLEDSPDDSVDHSGNTCSVDVVWMFVYVVFKKEVGVICVLTVNSGNVIVESVLRIGQRVAVSRVMF